MVSSLVNVTLPYRVVMGRGALGRLPGLLRELGGGRVAVFTDDNLYRLFVKGVVESLSEEVETEVYLVGEPTVEEAERARGFVIETRCDLVAAIGGGRVIDMAKYAAYRSGLDFVSVPTAVSHDGIASPTVSLKGEGGRPVSVYARPPAAILADLDVIARAPARLLISGFADIVGKFTSVRDALLAMRIRGERMSTYSLEIALTSARMVAKNAGLMVRRDPEGVRTLVEAAIGCGIAMSLAGSSRPCSGSEHLFSHALDIVCPSKPSLHGEQVGVGTIMMAYLHGLRWRRIRALLKRVGAPVDCEGLGVPPEAVVEALTMAHRVRDRYTILGESGLSREAAEKLARRTGVIPE